MKVNGLSYAAVQSRFRAAGLASSRVHVWRVLRRAGVKAFRYSHKCRRFDPARVDRVIRGIVTKR